MKNQNIRLGAKEKKILEFILKNKITTSKNINSNVYPSKGIRAINKVLSNLIAGGFIERKFIPNENSRSTTAYHLTKKGLSFSFPYLRDVKSIKLQSDKIEHDFMLTKIRQRFNQLKNVQKVWSENEILIASEFEFNESLDQLKGLRSDSALLINWNNSNHYFAVEYEASQKKQERVKNKFIDYYQKKEINGVIYVCKNNSILSFLVNTENKYNDSKRGKIYFITLDDFLQESKNLVFENRLGKELAVFS